MPTAFLEGALRRHLPLVAKTRCGKSSLLLRLAHYLMETSTTAGLRPELILVDPRQDLSRATRGPVPSGRRQDVVNLDVAERERPFGLSLLDTGRFCDRDQAVSNTPALFWREFERFLGPRREDTSRVAVLTLYDVNQAICHADPNGRAWQHTILEAPALLVAPAFRRSTLGLVSDRAVTSWWSGYFDRLDRRLQVEIANPVRGRCLMDAFP